MRLPATQKGTAVSNQKNEAVEAVALSQMGGTFAERKAAREAAEKAEEKAVQAAENKAVRKSSRKSG